MEKEENKEPKVTIFNEDIESWEEKKKDSKIKDKCCDHKCGHHRSRGSGVWGLVLLFVGVTLLLNNIGVVSKEIWIYVFPFWPIILIMIGIRLMFGHSRVARFFSFILALIFLTLIFISAFSRVHNPYYYNHMYLISHSYNFIH